MKLRLAEEQLQSEKMAHENTRRKMEDAQRDSQTLAEAVKSPVGENPLVLNFNDMHHNNSFGEETPEAHEKRKCGECPEKDFQIERLKALNANYERMSKETQNSMATLQEKVFRLNEQLQAQEDQNRLTLNSSRSQAMTTSSVLGGFKKTSALKESAFAQELLQKNLSREEENKRLKLKISRLNQELYENQRTYSQRVELLYTLIEKYIELK